MTEPTDERAAYFAAMRKLLDLLEEHPELPTPHWFGSSEWDRLSWYPGTPRAAANLVKALGGRWSKNDPKTSEFAAGHLVMKAALDDALFVELTVSREGVCEKKVVGTERVEVEKIITPAVKATVTEDRDVIEFECKSLLSLADQELLADMEAIAS